MVEIKVVNKNGTEYKNIDIRDIPFDGSIDIELMFNQPLEIDGKYGVSHSYKMIYNGEEVSTFVSDYFKSPAYGENLNSLMVKFKQGDKLRLSKHQGRMKDGRSFNYFNCIHLGSNEQGTPASVPSDVQPDVSINLEVTPTKPQYTPKEQQIVDGLKSGHSDYTNDVKVRVFMQNGIEEERANQIVKENF